MTESLNLKNSVKLLGYRTDIAELYKAADIYCHPSFREGLPVAVIEAMASGQPLICSDARGCRDLVTEANGLLVSPDDIDGFKNAIEDLISNEAKRDFFAENNSIKANFYNIDNINKMLESLYSCKGE